MTKETTTILPLQIVHTLIEYTNSSCVWVNISQFILYVRTCSWYS